MARADFNITKRTTVGSGVAESIVAHASLSGNLLTHHGTNCRKYDAASGAGAIIHKYGDIRHTTKRFRGTAPVEVSVAWRQNNTGGQTPRRPCPCLFLRYTDDNSGYVLSYQRWNSSGGLVVHDKPQTSEWNFGLLTTGIYKAITPADNDWHAMKLRLVDETLSGLRLKAYMVQGVAAVDQILDGASDDEDFWGSPLIDVSNAYGSAVPVVHDGAGVVGANWAHSNPLTTAGDAGFAVGCSSSGGGSLYLDSFRIRKGA